MGYVLYGVDVLHSTQHVVCTDAMQIALAHRRLNKNV